MVATKMKLYAVTNEESKTLLGKAPVVKTFTGLAVVVWAIASLVLLEVFLRW